ncbi:ABC transporter ATP-binding protein [Anaerocolumna sp. AGMB13025]|uniref:ABC transporter ATP-binding protein n=1 Tax=Anaerocolumna sp. AGMB13025 TaxID=3039116 RepID=UPI00241D38AC|nr:ABC transporter ATP-binding protein [Anaerocolumna sp. AGMB13025]WFR57118.1 ABC transporter ATP-binding protein [Anaerocolumna sp. AGMB13025]
MKKTKVTIRRMLKFELRLCFLNCPFLMTAEILASIIHGFSFVLVTIMTQKFFDKASTAIGHHENIEQVIIGAIILGVTVIGNHIINGGENYLWEVNYKKICGFSYRKLYQNVATVPAEEFENTKFLDNLQKAISGAEHFTQPLFAVIALSTFYLAYFLGMSWYIFKINPILSIAIILVFVPSFIGQFFKIYLYAKLADDSASHERKVGYYENCICGKEFLKETRTLGALPFFQKLYKEELELLANKRWKTNKKAALIGAVVKSITLLGYMGILILFVFELLHGKITVGVFSALYISIEKLFSMMDEVIETIGECTENIGLMRNYIQLLDYIEEKRKIEKKAESILINEGIDLSNVSYRYIDAENKALSNINLHITAGETVAIIGENGSGKTTLAKVITGLLNPSSGNILYSGKNISEYDNRSIYSNISIVSQYFQRYKMTLRNNITISSNKDDDASEIKDFLEHVGVDVNSEKFTEGLDTTLSREFDGIDLSGGQWQRISIARGLYRDHDLLVLDEPTAAIDPIEESNLFELFAELLKEKTSIIVTHRLGCVKLADRIVVMDGGKIIEEGKHDELIIKKGKYYEMYNAQAKWYVW